MEQLSNESMNHIASEKHRNKMHLLDVLCSSDNVAEDAAGKPLLHRDDTVRDKHMPVHMMYKYGAPLISKDGCRAYTFNIEYCTDTPSEGIYYGAFGVVLRGTIDEHKKSFDHEWNAIRPIAAQVLGNTFDNPYFNMLFRQTDNVNDNTYWPFWISLGEDEDIVEVAYRAVRIIRRIYEAYFANEIDKSYSHARKSTVKKPSFSCTEKAFENIGENGKAENIKDEVLCFFKWCESNHLLCRNKLYDMAWTITTTPTKFAFLIETYFGELMKQNIYKKRSIPWKALGSILLNQEGLLIGEGNLKTLISQIRGTTKEPGNTKKTHENEQYAQEELKNYFTLSKHPATSL